MMIYPHSSIFLRGKSWHCSTAAHGHWFALTALLPNQFPANCLEKAVEGGYLDL